jgi:type IV pilus assembly protein PilN
MLIEINLLPKKEKKNFSLSIMIAFIAFISIFGSSLFVYYGKTLQTKADQLSTEIQNLNEALQIEQQQVIIAEKTNSVLELKKAVKWAESYPIKAVPVLQHLTSLLPERGFIQQYTYSQAGNVGITVQFDTSREAAYFLRWLNNSEWITEASISSLSVGGSDEAATDLVPRYIGQYQIILEREKLREIINQEKNMEQGGHSS